MNICSDVCHFLFQTAIIALKMQTYKFLMHIVSIFSDSKENKL